MNTSASPGSEADVDVLVAGGGMAGMAAAASAAAVGARVGVVEKGRSLGGSAALSAGILWCAPDYESIREAIPGGDPTLQRVVVDEFADAVEFVRGTGVEVSERSGGHMGFGFGHQIDIIGFIDRLRARVEASGGWIARQTAVQRSLAADGGAAGASLDGPDGRSEVTAGGVVLATGGFQGDSELRATLIGDRADEMLVRANPHSVGDGLRLGTQLGAALSGGLTAFYGHLLPAPIEGYGEQHFLPLTQYHSNRCLVVNLLGRRFMDESRGDEHATQEVLRQPQSRAFLLADEEIRARYVVAAPYPHGEVVDRFQEAVKAGALFEEADTIEGLIAALAAHGVPPGNLRQTLETYVRAASGHPEELDAPLPSTPTPLTSPPFYALLVQPVITFTHGGLLIDRDCRVIARSGEPIPGLFAAGADAGGVHNVGYAGGLASSLVLGRRAGRTAAARAAAFNGGKGSR